MTPAHREYLEAIEAMSDRSALRLIMMALNNRRFHVDGFDEAHEGLTKIAASFAEEEGWEYANEGDWDELGSRFLDTAPAVRLAGRV